VSATRRDARGLLLANRSARVALVQLVAARAARLRLEVLVTEPSRPWLSCCVLLVTACGAGDDRLDPRDLELRDLLGVAPEIAGAWDHDQRAAARHVIDAGLHPPPAPPGRAALGADPAFERSETGGRAPRGIDRRLAKALASIDADRARHHAGALGVVDVAVGASGVVATPHLAALEPHATPPLDLQLRGWDGQPGLSQLPARGMDVLATLASDAGHRGGPITVAPVPGLAVVAGYLPATASEPARLVVNPVVLAALEPRDPPAAERAQRPVATAPAATASPAGAASTAANAAGNPYSFYGSVAECAAAQRARCDACLAGGSCTAITNLGDGKAECTQLTANGGRGDYLICINLALAIDAVAACAASSAPSCQRDTHASESISSLEANAGFLDDPACAAPLDACLATLYGASSGGYPGPGSDAGGAPPPRNTSIGCGDSVHGDPNCDASPDCELDGPSCDAPYDGTCSDSSEQSGCSDAGGDGGDGGGGGDSCSGDSGDSGDSCSSGDSSSCDSGSGGDCSSDSGGDCSSDSGGDCSGDSGGDCSAAGRRGRTGAGLPVAIAWALLPIPFATIARRRAERRRARAESDAEPADAEGPGAP
jgi:hypothetical protein